MNVPRFAAEASLGPALGVYRGTAAPPGTAFAATTAAIEPQQRGGFGNRFGVDCFGSADQCENKFCVNLPPGKQRAECFAACQNPSVCSGCQCSCSPNCNRTCGVTCTRRTTSGSAILRCTGSCFPFDEATTEVDVQG
jgi:hypothetical protein